MPSLQWRDPRDEDGAYTVEFLAVIVSLMITAMIVLQVFLVFLNAILVQHAMALAAQEASARGGVTTVVETTFESHLPSYMVRGPTGDGTGANCTPVCLQADSYGGSDHNGGETSHVGDLITFRYSYTQGFPLLSLLGINVDPTITRVMSVGAQSHQT